MRTKTPRLCKHCNGPILGKSRMATLCSEECKKNFVPPAVDRECRGCGCTYSATDARSRFCTDECKKAFTREEVTRKKNERLDANCSGTVVCLICGNKFTGGLTKHLRVSHDLSVEEYSVAYPDSDILSANYRSTISTRMIGDKNPGFGHGGTRSPWSDKSIFHSAEAIESAKRKAISRSLANPNNATHHTNVEYYTAQGLSLSAAIDALRDRQSTFSHAKCVSKYGHEVGHRVWKERQERWQATINSKSELELERINRLKSSGINYRTLWRQTVEVDVPGAFYMIDLGNFVKIGVTSRHIRTRYPQLGNTPFQLYQFDTIAEAFRHEQVLKRLLSDYAIRRDEQIAPYGWTETFKLNLDEVISAYESIKSNVDTIFEEIYVKRQRITKIHGGHRRQ